jgi:PLP dependent protein
MTALNENLERLEEAIAGLPAGGRQRGEVELMAVSKTYPAATMAEAAALGLTLFGENRVQEFGRQGCGFGRAAADSAIRFVCI